MGQFESTCRRSAQRPLAWDEQCRLARRAFLGRWASGVGSLALGSLLSNTSRLMADQSHHAGDAPALHRPARAKRVIFLCMAGGPSHLETLDYKPKLAEMHGQSMPASFTDGQPIAQLQGQKLTCLAPQHPFAHFVETGVQPVEASVHV